MKQISVGIAYTGITVAMIVAATLAVTRPASRPVDSTGVMREVVVRAEGPRGVMEEVVVRADRYAGTTVPASAGASIN